MKRDMDIVRNLLLSSRGTTSGEYCETDVLPVIKARLQFVQIGIKMFDRELGRQTGAVLGCIDLGLH